MLGWNLAVVLILTTLLVILYVSLGGLWSLAYVQVANLVLFTVGLAVAAYYSLHGHAVFTTPVPKQPHFQGLAGGGLAMILVWFGMNILNSVSAQAEFQTISSAKSVRKGKLGVYLSSIVLVGFAIVPTLLGMAARTHHIAMKSGLLAFPTYLRMVAPHWAVLLVGLGFWAAALIWCAPLMFSGASSFGLDLFNRKQQSHDTSAVRRFTRLSMLIQGALIVIYALIRPGELAWWAVFGLTLRNAAIVGPTLTFLLWPAVRERTVLLSMVVGVAGGLGWNAFTGFSATTFAFHINPMWVGTGLSMTVIILGTFFENRKALQWNRQLKKRYLGWSIGAIGLLLIIASPALTHGAYRSLLGVDLFLSILCLFFTAMLSTELRDCANEAELSNCQRGICGKKIRRILESR
ncbi:hypothetical protein ATW55_01315 [Ferroacidibacillus organovorans]|uniref:Uncharacterized protein n=1 Tax=Ferroacidibacillus organovorans TaxID=1765683 RepID=A0A101XR64_9BACL|nr:hypothetical protein ATW55_01315 [Ferroacidibacillus organovorans]